MNYYEEWKREIIDNLQTKYKWTEEEATVEVNFHFGEDFDKIHYANGLSSDHIAYCIDQNNGFYDELMQKDDLV